MDHLDEQGNRYAPYFKGQWNEELLLAPNYLCHLMVYRSELLRQLGDLRPGEGAQGHDLGLRCALHYREGQICHIPRVLYHWCHFDVSGAASDTRRRRCVREYLAARGMRATVDAEVWGFNRVLYALPDPSPRVPCIVLARDHAPVTDRCLESVLHRSLYRALDLILVDNGSTKEDAWVLCNAYDGHPQVSVIHWDWPFNFSKINNMAAERTRGELLVFLNNDAKVITPDWVEILAGYALQPRIGAVAPKLLYPDGSIQHAGIVMLGTAHIVREAFKGRPDDSEEYFARTQAAHWVCVVTSVCLMVEKHKFLESGGLEERLAVTFNDIDFCCWLYEAGYRNVYTPYAILRHHEFTSRSAVEDTLEKQLRAHKENSYMRDRWVALAVDPFYSIHFSRQEDTYRIIRPNEGSVTAWSAPHGLHAGREGGESK